MFDPPEGQAPYTYVFDLTGDIVVDRPEAVGSCSSLSAGPLHSS